MRRIAEDVLFPARKFDLVACLKNTTVIATDDDSANPGTITGKVFKDGNRLRAGEFLVRAGS